MMKEMIKKSLGFWNNYWGDSVFPYLLAIALLYLLIFKRKKKTTRYVLGYVFLALFLFFFPYTAKIIQKCIGENVYWRVLWLVPSTPVIGPGNDRVYPGKKGSFAAGSPGALYSSDRSWWQRVLYRRILS